MILEGKKVAERLNQTLKEKIKSLPDHLRTPHLAIILVGEHPASLSYIKGKLKAAKEVLMTATLHQLPETSTQEEVHQLIQNLNSNEEVDGIILQLPLPKHLNSRDLIDAISVDKDADGFHTLNQGKLYQSLGGIQPATPKGIMALLKYYDIEIKGKHAVIVGRSNIVGFPVARLLMDQGATITVCHSQTVNLSHQTKQADILIAAAGKPKLITKDMVKEGAIVVDVGIHSIGGHLVGDVDFEQVNEVASWITPVPKGVGPMTIQGLLENTYELYLRKYRL
jgi:methylenetetrahydrofolate dehydrogenase (NADP+) / methenyltetrahydrofolate cyclohydrolase